MIGLRVKNTNLQNIVVEDWRVFLSLISLILVDLEVNGVFIHGAGILTLRLLLCLVHDGLLLLLQRLVQHDFCPRLFFVGRLFIPQVLVETATLKGDHLDGRVRRRLGRTALVLPPTCRRQLVHARVAAPTQVQVLQAGAR